MRRAPASRGSGGGSSIAPSAAALAAAAVTVLLGCSRPSDLREWRPTDHDGPPASPTSAPPGAPAETTPNGDESGIDASVVDVWRARCVRCHGPAGTGDGPDGSPLRAANLTDRTRLGRRTDAELRAVIRDGRGAMPGFGQDGPLLDGLVKLVRLIGRAPGPPSVAAPDAAAPDPSAAPGAPSPSATATPAIEAIAQ